jgi:hypothetical protein
VTATEQEEPRKENRGTEVTTPISNNPPLYKKLSELLSVEQHRYTCRACDNFCELIVRGKITRIRQKCLQFQAMDGYCLWVEQQVVER